MRRKKGDSQLNFFCGFMVLYFVKASAHIKHTSGKQHSTAECGNCTLFGVVVQGPASKIHHEIGFIGFLFVHLYLPLC